MAQHDTTQSSNPFVQRLEQDLIGPDAVAETLRDKPSDRYLTGILFPQKLELAPIRRSSGHAIVWCLSLPDLMLAKLAAGRPHDVTFVEEALAAKLLTVDELRRGIDLMPESSRVDVARWLDGLEAKLSRR